MNILARTESWRREWSGRCTYEGPHSEVVQRSLITLKALYAPTGAIVATLTTSLQEDAGGERNWDYRYCWLRDGSFTLAPLVQAGYMDEAVAWRDWLFRAIAGDPNQLQIMYGIGGEHRLTELELPWLSGYEGSKPVRIGNAANEQFQVDIFGEVMAVLYGAWEAGLPERDVTRSPGDRRRRHDRTRLALLDGGNVDGGECRRTAGGEGAFLICSFWLVSALAQARRMEEAERNLEQLMALQTTSASSARSTTRTTDACWETSRRCSRPSDCCARSLRSQARQQASHEARKACSDGMRRHRTARYGRQTTAL